jgi:hypothetical protein
MADLRSDQRSRAVTEESIYALRRRGASDDLIRAAQKGRRRKATIKIGWPTFPFSVRWPELDCCTGQGGHGLFRGLRIWWSVRRGTWEDDWMHDMWDENDLVAPDETEVDRG